MGEIKLDVPAGSIRGRNSLFERESFRQFVKFCIIGFGSAIIDGGVARFLTYHVGLQWEIARTISFTLAVTNGFFWNQRWTFNAVGRTSSSRQYTMFFAVNIVGLLLNLLIMGAVFLMFTGKLHTGGKPDSTHWYIAFFTAITIVSFWNFIANKYWTFK
ncbi:MAG: GtrA family protein [Armatimonadetes bacterium]|nr:GtrA family protein [Armatimonadota bacterium]